MIDGSVYPAVNAPCRRGAMRRRQHRLSDKHGSVRGANKTYLRSTRPISERCMPKTDARLLLIKRLRRCVADGVRQTFEVTTTAHRYSTSYGHPVHRSVSIPPSTTRGCDRSTVIRRRRSLKFRLCMCRPVRRHPFSTMVWWRSGSKRFFGAETCCTARLQCMPQPQ